MTHATTIRKLRILRSELAEYRAHEDAIHSLDATIHAAPSVRGSSWSQVQRYLSPEILLRLDRGQVRPVYALLTEWSTPVAVTADVESVDEWLRANERVSQKEELSAAFRLLESAISRNLAGTDLSKTQSALQQVKRGLKL